MPIPTPFHGRTAPLCQSYEWRDWAGYLAAGTYEPSHEREYYAVRSAAALFDISPLFKYEISGPDALRLVDRIMTRDITRCAIGQVMYAPWCDEAGKIIDDGTIARLGEDHFRLTAAEPNLYWFQEVGFGMEATVVDVSEELAALALQGPNARRVLKALVSGADLDALRYFRFCEAKIGDIPLTITRTGYTGDLGYELWLRPDDAEPLWDRLLETGAGYGLAPAGLVALDMVRIEAGLLLAEVDYISAHKALIEAQKSSPFEIGLGWTVALNAANFIGRKALLAEKQRGSAWQFVGLEVDWPALERLFDQVDLPPQVAGRASRAPAPIYNERGRQIGQATSHTFSPLLKSYIAIGVVETPYAAAGTLVDLEMTVEYSRERVRARVVETPFFNPRRKRR
jgi:aminomethyltransferase